MTLDLTFSKKSFLFCKIKKKLKFLHQLNFGHLKPCTECRLIEFKFQKVIIWRNTLITISPNCFFLSFLTHRFAIYKRWRSIISTKKMWLKLKKTNENYKETNENIAYAYLTIKNYRDNSELYRTLTEKARRKKLSKIYANLWKNGRLSDEVRVQM